MPFVVADKQLPTGMVELQQKVLKVVQLLNVLVPFLEASSGTWFTLQVFGGKPSPSILLKGILDVNTYLVGALEIVSGVCLFYAVHQINKFVKESGTSINKRALITHALSFGLYLVGVIVMDCYYFNYQMKQSVSTESEQARIEYMHAEFFWVASSFLAQLFLCAIFWQLGTNRNRAPADTEEYPEIEVVDFDDHAELQARIWN